MLVQGACSVILVAKTIIFGMDDLFRNQDLNFKACSGRRLDRFSGAFAIDWKGALDIDAPGIEWNSALAGDLVP